ncbi:MAG: hypothetical protein GC129_03865 [Proteobacteria bacterium]|nr:hypothetical protein [Pseudomonadota bacterium]
MLKMRRFETTAELSAAVRKLPLAMTFFAQAEAKEDKKQPELTYVLNKRLPMRVDHTGVEAELRSLSPATQVTVSTKKNVKGGFVRMNAPLQAVKGLIAEMNRVGTGDDPAAGSAYVVGQVEGEPVRGFVWRRQASEALSVKVLRRDMPPGMGAHWRQEGECFSLLIHGQGERMVGEAPFGMKRQALPVQLQLNAEGAVVRITSTDLCGFGYAAKGYGGPGMPE